MHLFLNSNDRALKILQEYTLIKSRIIKTVKKRNNLTKQGHFKFYGMSVGW